MRVLPLASVVDFRSDACYNCLTALPRTTGKSVAALLAEHEPAATHGAR